MLFRIRVSSPVVIALAVLALALSLPHASALASARAVERTWGSERIATAVAASAEHRDAADTVLVATAFDFPDSLAAAALSAHLDAPLLLTMPGELPDVVAAEVSRLGATEAYVLGGRGAVSDRVVAGLRDAGASVERLGGENRYATAANLALTAGPSATGEAVLALGAHRDPDKAWPDAVAAGALAASPDRIPVLLTATNQLPAETEEALEDLEVTDVIVVGGDAAIAPSVIERLDALGYGTRRIAGASRYETGVELAEEALARLDGDDHPVVFATGNSFPDALAAGALASRLDAPLVMVPPTNASGAVEAFLRAREDGWTGGVVLGGQVAASDFVVEQLDAAITGRPAPEPPPEESELAAAEPEPEPEPEPQVTHAFEGTASWYGPGFHGRPTASGEPFDRNAMTAAHRTLPFNTIVRVTNTANGRQVEVRINDRGPYSGGRVIDLAEAAANHIGMIDTGTAWVRVEVLDR